MNKLFKVIWSKSKQCYIVVSEVAKNTTGKKKIVVASVLAALTVGTQVATVEAAIQEGSASNGAVLSLVNTATAKGTSAVAIGTEANASTTNALAVGTSTISSGDGSVAVGSGSKATGASAVAVGAGAYAKEHGAVALGNNVNVETNKAVGVGFALTVRKAGATNIGYYSTVNANQALSVGARNDVDEVAQYGTAVGYFVKVTAKNGVAIGSSNDNNGNSDTGRTLASADSAVAIGTSAHAEAASAVGIGTRAKAQLAHSVALGEGSTTVEADGTATTGYLTNDAVNNTGNGIISVGNKRNSSDSGTILRRIVSVASGSDDFDAVNVKQLKALESVSLNTLVVNNSGAKTDVVPTDRKITLTAGKNITLTNNNGEVTIASKSEVNSISSSNTDAVTVTTAADGKVSVTPNLANDINATGDANKLVTAGKVKEALADKVSTAKLTEELNKKANAADVTSLTTNKLDKTAELHVVKGTYAVAADGSVTLNKADGAGTVKADEAVKITGLASKSALDALTTTVEGKADKSYVDGELGKKANAAEVTKELAKKADAATVNAELAKKANAADIANLTTDKVNKTDELHVKKGTYNVEADGRVILKKADGTGADKAGEDVIIAGVAKQSDVNTIKTELATKVSNDAFTAEKDRVNTALSTKLDEATFNTEKANFANRADIEALKEVIGNKLDKDTADKFIKGMENKVSADELNTRLNDAAADAETKLNAAKNELGNKITEATKNKLDKSDELHVIAKEYTADQATGTVTIEQENANNDKQAGKEFTITGLATKKDVSDLTTKVEAKAEKSYVDEKLAEKADAATVANLGTDKVDKTDELHVVKGTYKVTDAGTVTLDKADGAGTVKADEAVTITDVASKKKLDEVTGRVDTAEGRLDTAEGKITTAEGKITAAEGRLDTAEGKITAAEGRLDTADGKIKAAEDKIKGIEDNIRDNIATNAAVAEKLNNLKDELGNNTALSFAGDKVVDPTDPAATKLSLNLKDGVLKVKGATDEITTTAEGDTITVGLSKKAKDSLAKVEKLGDTSADGRDGVNGTAKNTGLTGQDGLNGKTLTDKVNALRNGEAGSVVYTDDKGNRLAKGNDGKYYLPTELDETGSPIGTVSPVEDDKVQASVMNPDGTNNPTKLSNLKDGKVVADSKDAVTGNQLHKVANGLAEALGGGATVGEDGTITKPTYNLTGADGNPAPKDNVGDALTLLNDRLNHTAAGAEADIEKLKNLEGLTAEGEKKLKKLAGDAVDVKGDKNITISSTMEDGVKTFHATLSEKVTLGKHDANDPDGDHANDPGVELDGHEGTIVAGNPEGNTAVKIDGKDGSVTAGKDDKQVKLDGEHGKVTVGNPKGEKFVELDATTGGVQANKVTAGKDNKAVSLDGNEGTITAGNGTDGNQVTIKGTDGSVTAKTVKAKDSEFGAPLAEGGAPAEAGKNNTKITDEGISVVGKDKDGNKATVGIKDGRVTAGDEVGEDGIPTKAGSATSMDKDGFSVATKGKDGKESKVDIKNGGITAGAPVDAEGNPTKEGTATSMDRDKGFSVTSKDKDGNVSTVGINNGRVSAGDKVDANGIPEKAGSATSMDKDGFSVATKDKDGKVSKVDIKNGGITAGAPVDANGIPTEKNATAVSMGKDGLSVISTDENGKALTPITIKNGKISGLQPGTEDTDVATVGQVKSAIGKTAELVEKTSQRLDQVGAHSAALAAMNPLSYDPLRKSQIMAGIGSYAGNQALALGIAHYANENFMFNAGFTMGSGKSMANIGATYRFGTGDDDNLPERYKGGPISSVYVMQDEIAELKAENARKDAENAEMKAQIKMLMQRMGMA